ncbi:MAG: alcohol dehydrogenase catalytic domain-containing protein [Anaerolineae bacterium]
MSEKLNQYRQATILSQQNRLWPLYGAGFENLGQNGQPITVDFPGFGPDELLVRHDACGICFSDIKVINAGEQHPRIFRDMKKEPVVLGHEVTLTIVGVGENLREQYRVGDRFVVQAEIYYSGINYAYGYMIQGGMSQYSVIGERILHGDDGNYLLPIQPHTGYAESALAEPWACVVATYNQVYRTKLKAGGVTWIIGTPQARDDYFFSAGLDEHSHPAKLVLSHVPSTFEARLRQQAARLGIEVVELPVERQRIYDERLRHEERAVIHFDPLPPGFDDIIILGPDPDVIEAVSPHLLHFGIVAIVTDTPLPRPVEVDIGQVHYHRSLYIGGPGPDIAGVYSRQPVRSEVKGGGKTWLVGAGGPMGHMHAQTLLQADQPPGMLLCTALTGHRLATVESEFGPKARAKGIDFVCLSADDSNYQQRLAELAGVGFDDIIVLAPSAAAVSEAAAYIAEGGVVNVFAGLKRGTLVTLDLNLVCQRGVRFIGHSGSTIADLTHMLQQVERGQLSPNHSVAAVGSLEAAREGYLAVRDAAFPGKIVIFPQIKPFPLTPLSELRDKLPSVYALLKEGKEWTLEAEQEFLELMLPF